MKVQTTFNCNQRFAAAILAASAMAALPLYAATIQVGTLVQVQVKIVATATRPEGFYLIADKTLDPGGLVVQGTTMPASCANNWLFVPKDGFYDSKVYRDTVSTIQLAATLGKNVTIATTHCAKNYEVTTPAPHPYNYPVIYGVDVGF